MSGVQSYDLAGYRNGGLLPCARPDIEPYRATDALQLLFSNTLLHKARRPIVGCPAGPHRPDVPRRGLQRLLTGRNLGLGVVDENANDGTPVHRGCQDDPVAHELADPGDGVREITVA